MDSLTRRPDVRWHRHNRLYEGCMRCGCGQADVVERRCFLLQWCVDRGHDGRYWGGPEGHELWRVGDNRGTRYKAGADEG